jgi:hypothetical protein
MPSPTKAALPFLLCFIFGTAVIPFASAAAKKGAKPPPDPRILIVEVKPATREIVIVYKRTGQKETYKIDDFTQVTVVSYPGTFADIKTGQQIFAYTERDAHTLDYLTVGPPDPAPVAPK